jgi:hypothetical protein
MAMREFSQFRVALFVLGLFILPMLLGTAFFVKMMEMDLKIKMTSQTQKNHYNLTRNRTAI